MKPTPSTICHRTDKTRCQFQPAGSSFQCIRSKGGCGAWIDSKMPEYQAFKKDYEAKK